MENDEIQIRYGNNDDREAVLQIAGKLTKWFDADAISRAIPTDLNFHKIIVATQDSQIVGFLSFSSEEGHVFISWLGVSEEVQGRGIGTKLLKFLEEELLKLNINKLQAETLSEKIDYEPYVKTRAFYEKMGFKKAESRKIKSADGEDIELVIYRKDLIKA